MNLREKVEVFLAQFGYKITFLATILVVLFTFLYSGYLFGAQDQNLYIPIIKNLSNPDLFANDPLVAFAGDKSTIIWYVVVFLLHFFSIEIIFFLFQFISFVLFLIGSFLIAREISTNKYTPLIATTVLASSKVTLMTIGTYSDYFAPRFLALSIGVFSFYFLLKKNVLAAILLAVLSVYINAIVGMPVIGIVLLLYFYEHYKENFFESVKYFLLSISLILPLFLYRQLNSAGGSDLVIDRDWFNFSRNSLSLFYDVPLFDGSSFEVYANLFGYLGIILTPFLIHKLLNGYIKRVFYAIYGLNVVAFVLHFILANSFPVAIIMQLQINRSIVWVSILFYILYAKYLIDDYKNGESGLKLPFGILLGYFSFGQIYIMGNEFTQKIQNLIPKQFKSLFGFILIALISGTTMYYYFFLFNFEKIQIFPIENELYDVQIWMRDNTETDAFFLVPPYIDESSTASFRVYSERSIFVLNSELAQAAISRGLGESLEQRLGAISDDDFEEALYSGSYGRIYRSMYAGYNDLSEPEILELESEYGLDFVITEKPMELTFKLVYENDRFRVYGLK